MKHYLTTLFILLLTSSITYGQGKGKAGDASAAAQAAAPAPSSSVPTNILYHISADYHLKYRSKNVQTVVKEYQKLANVKNYVVKVYTAVLTRTIDTTVQILASHQQQPESWKKAGAHIFERDGELKKINVQIRDTAYWKASSTVISYKSVDVVQTTDSVTFPKVVNVTLRVDNLERYLDDGMRALLIPLDSGKLQTVPRIDISDLDTKKNNYNIIRYKPTGNIGVAVPMSVTDSVHNFYLQIDDNPLVSQPFQQITKSYVILLGGTALIPYKYRFANQNQVTVTNSATKVSEVVYAPSESTINYSLAFYFGQKIGITHFYFNSANNTNSTIMISEFIGPSLIPISASNVRYDTDPLTLPTQAFAVSAGIAVSLELGSFNLGLFYGRDYIIPKDIHWVYNNKPWVGLGIGFNLTSMFTGQSIQKAKL